MRSKEIMLDIREAETAADIEQVRTMLLEYQAAVGVDLCFQGFAEEVATLPGLYAPPEGRLILGVDGPAVLGMIGLRPFHGADCEMKRLFVRPAGRGRGLGRLLATALIDAARLAGYRRVLLDTLPAMFEAQALYRSLGFTEIPAYRENPVAGTTYMALSI